MFTPVPTDPHTPTGVGLDDDTWTVPDAPQALPWGTAPATALPTTTPRPYWRYDKTLDLRKSVEYHLRNRSTARDPTPTPRVQPSVTNRPSTSRSHPRPSRQAPPAAPAAPAPASPPLVMAPVQPTGVPGSSHDGIDTVSVVNNKLNYFSS